MASVGKILVLSPELDRDSGTCRDVRPGGRCLLARDAAAHCIELKASVLGGFYGAAERLAHEGGYFNAALLNVQNHGAAGGHRRFRFGIRFGWLRFTRGWWRCAGYLLSHCRLDYRRAAAGSRGRERPRHICRL